MRNGLRTYVSFSEPLHSISSSSVWEKLGSLLLHGDVILQSFHTTREHALPILFIAPQLTARLRSETWRASGLHLPNSFTSTEGGSATFASVQSSVTAVITSDTTQIHTTHQNRGLQYRVGRNKTFCISRQAKSPRLLIRS